MWTANEFLDEFKDLVVALGQLSYQDMAFECSRAVIRIGKKVKAFQVSNLVCGLTQSAFASIVRTQQPLISHRPQEMDCKTSVSFPFVCRTALFSLRYAAALQKGESILVHCAAGDGGLAAVMLARYIGAEIFIMVSSPEKASVVASLYNVPEDHIFSSRDTTFEPGVKRKTKGIGVDVDLNCLAGEAMQASWSCLASFSCFVEIGRRDVVQNNRLEMGNLAKSVTFSAADLALLVDEKPPQSDGRDRGNAQLKTVFPLNFYSMSGIQDAMRSMQAGKQMGKWSLNPRRMMWF